MSGRPEIIGDHPAAALSRSVYAALAADALADRLAGSVGMLAGGTFLLADAMAERGDREVAVALRGHAVVVALQDRTAVGVGLADAALRQNAAVGRRRRRDGPIGTDLVRRDIRGSSDPRDRLRRVIDGGATAGGNDCHKKQQKTEGAYEGRNETTQEFFHEGLLFSRDS